MRQCGVERNDNLDDKQLANDAKCIDLLSLFLSNFKRLTDTSGSCISDVIRKNDIFWFKDHFCRLYDDIFS